MKLSTFVLSGLAAAALAVSAIALPTIAKEMTVEVGGAPMYPSKNIIRTRSIRKTTPRSLPR